MKFAVVDDDVVFRLSAKMLINSLDGEHSIIMLENGEEAINFLYENRSQPDMLPEILLLDLSMPVLDGWEFLEQYLPLKDELTKDITIYIVTSSIDQADIKRAESISTVKGYLIKPISRAQLKELIVSLL
tara:strand:- start:2528 stop:2917 length:390 start_codon:yes stop_codon:yes gene_type:complete